MRIKPGMIMHSNMKTYKINGNIIITTYHNSVIGHNVWQIYTTIKLEIKLNSDSCIDKSITHAYREKTTFRKRCTK